jgi:histidine ammonia-lyase
VSPASAESAEAAARAKPTAERHGSGSLVLDGQHLTLHQVVSIARGGAGVSVPSEAMQRVQHSFDVLLEAAREDKPIYGLTRGVGENKDKTVFPGGQITPAGRHLSEQFNVNLLRVQATATGPPAAPEVVRAAMAIRLNAMLIGHSGVEPTVVQGLADLLNHEITPVVPSEGTVGEADIDILSHIGLALIGEGDVYYAGKTVPAETALQAAGLKPLVPFGKDALSIFSSNAYSAALAILAAADARHLLTRARQVFALSLEGLNGNIAPFLAEAQGVREFPGQATVAAAVCEHLAGSYLFSLDPHRALQDPLSFRTFSQVLGSAEDILARLDRQLTTQINTADDNPTVLPGAIPPPGATPQELAYYVRGNGVEGAVIPTANFEPLSWVIQLESLAVALAHVSDTSAQRIMRFGTPEFTRLSRFLTADATAIGYAAIQKIPADFAARNHRLADPVSLDVIPVAGDIEDTATNAAAAATNVSKIVENTFSILAVELMHAAQAVDLRQKNNPAFALGRGTRPFLHAYRQVVPFLDKDRQLSPDIAQSTVFLGGSSAADGALKDAKTFFDHGEFFRAYDLAADALELFPGDVWLAHRAVLSLANAGATSLALEKYYEFGLDDRSETDIRSLLGRLKKDQAFGETGEARVALFRQGRALYEDAFRAATDASDPEAYYPAINAATLALFAGDAEAANRLAGEVLDLVAPRIASLDEAAPDRYWVLATALEAHLVRGDLDAADGLADQVVAAADRDDAALATTGRQLERIVAAKNLGASVLAAFKMPTVVHFLGPMIAAPPGHHDGFRAEQAATVAADIAALVEGMRISAAYGSLAAGADILFAEALLEQGAALNIVLPFALEDFIEQAVRPAGEAWVARFEACLAAAKTVRFATEEACLGDDQLFPYSTSLAMGHASLCARHLHAPLMQLAVWDGVVDDGGIAGTAADMSAWRQAGHPVRIVPVGSDAKVEKLPPWHRPEVARGRRDTRAMLFGELHGFSKLTDAQMPTFAKTVMAPLGEVARRHKRHITFIKTWGDGIFVVFRNADRAAACALDMQDAMSAIDLKAAGLPQTLKMRLGGHLGPVYELDDPITGGLDIYGANVSRAARIEPITPEGCVCVTETFAAVLALHNAAEFSCDYVGNTEMTKRYGRLRMFLLRRPRDGTGPVVLGDIERAAG